MRPRHHPHSDTILAYAAGSVEESFSLLIAAHAERCHTCGRAIAEAESLAGSILDALPPVAMRGNSFERLWESAEKQGETERSGCRLRTESDLPTVLTHLLPDGLSGIRWGSWVPGIHQYRLKDVQSGAGSVRLLRIGPGVVIPEHIHAGSELTLILSGNYSDQTGHFGPGDLADLDDSVRHRPVVDSGQPCICLVATDQPLRFSKVLNRMMQPLLGI
ncbi:MAG: ChrR family anti-sigma-E factor [Gammaproteobacteria bacterium]|nr:ChrR family anti-sigma-E factor [Gammaproteobacteria bacterium]